MSQTESSPEIASGQSFVSASKNKYPLFAVTIIPQNCLDCSTAWQHAIRGRQERLVGCAGMEPTRIGETTLQLCTNPTGPQVRVIQESLASNPAVDQNLARLQDILSNLRQDLEQSPSSGHLLGDYELGDMVTLEQMREHVASLVKRFIITEPLDARFVVDTSHYLASLEADAQQTQRLPSPAAVSAMVTELVGELRQRNLGHDEAA